MRPDRLPQYPGGLEGLLHDYYSQLKYPVQARKNGWQGRFSITYIIEKDGSLSEIESDETHGPVHTILKEAAIVALKTLKRWHPGFTEGAPVRVKLTQPVSFKLERK
jgi:protein TonB